METLLLFVLIKILPQDQGHVLYFHMNKWYTLAEPFLQDFLQMQANYLGKTFKGNVGPHS